MTVPQTSPGFWRSFDRDHEALPSTFMDEGLKTTQHTHTHVGGFRCAQCEMPAHLEHRFFNGIPASHLPVPELTFERSAQSIWVARHGPAPHRANHRNPELAGQTPIIVLPDARGVAESQTRRHYVHGIGTGKANFGYVAECGIGDLYRYALGDCWHIAPCENCLKFFR